MNVAPPVLHAAPAVVGEQGSRPRILEAAAGRSAIQEVDPDGPMLPPAGAARADTVVVTAGTVLLLILAVAFSGPVPPAAVIVSSIGRKSGNRFCVKRCSKTNA